MTIVQWFLVGLGVLMSALGGFFLKLGAVQVQYSGGLLEIAIQIIFNWMILAGVLLYFFPVVIWIVLLKKIELSFLQPLFSLVYVITPALSIIYLKEDLPLSRWLGIIIIVLGVLIVARS